jgi:hypothetical protein
VTAIADLISRADRDRLLKRLAELRDLDGVMRERVGLAPTPIPTPLHRMGQQRRQRDSDNDNATTGQRQRQRPTDTTWRGTIGT